MAEGAKHLLTSTTAVAPEFLTQNLSAAIPLKNALPAVAPYRQTLPTIMFSSDLKSWGNRVGGYTITVPPDKP